MTLGISACLVGEKVRYDGSHKLDPCLLETLGRFVRLVPFCPEVECGLGVPRGPIRLKRKDGHVMMEAVETGNDVTGPMERSANELLDRLGGLGLSGMIFKSRSPSCALEDAPIFGEGAPGTGKGLFTRMALERFLLVPMADEAYLHRLEGRENFVQQILRPKALEGTAQETAR